MLKIKTKLNISKIEGAGIGLFSDQFIPKDTIIWEFTPGLDLKITEPEFDSLNEIDKKFMETYCFKYDGYYVLCIDNSRFFNHSKAPNCYSADFDKKSLGFTKAIRDIDIGEELTDDYSKFGFSEDDKNFNTDL